MLKKIHLICASALILLGVVHTSLTPVIIGRFSMGALYFASAGLAMILLGFLNLSLRSDNGNRVLRILCHTANIVMTAFAAFAVIVIPEPQAYFGVAVIIIQTLSAFSLKRA